MYVCMYINNIYLLCMIKVRIGWCIYLKYVENVITSGKLIGLLFLFCLPLLSILFLKTKRNDLARHVMGTIFLVYIKRKTTAFSCFGTPFLFQNKSPHLRSCENNSVPRVRGFAN